MKDFEEIAKEQVKELEKQNVKPDFETMQPKSALKKPIYKKWWFWVIIAVMLIGVFAPSEDDDTGVNDTGANDSNADSAVSDVATYAEENGITEAQANAVFDICKQIGIEPKAMNNEHEMNWEGYAIHFAFDGDSIEYVSSGLAMFYVKDAEYLYKVSDLLPTIQERANAQLAAENSITKILKAPKTAEFPGRTLDPFEDWSFTKNEDGSITVYSYVDSQNGFGALIRSQFEITILFDGDNYKVTGLIFDGDKII